MSDDKPRRALVLSGGGSKGAFEVGVLQRLMGDERADYDLLCGTSVGAINAAYIAQTPLGRQRARAFERHFSAARERRRTTPA